MMISFRGRLRNILACFACLLILLSACGSNRSFSDSIINPPGARFNGTPPAPYDQQVLRFAVVSSQLDLTSLDPASAFDINALQADALLFNGLVRIDSNLQVQPELASSWQQAPDGLRWTFHIRPHLFFSDGSPLTSQDIIYSINRSLMPAFNPQPVNLKDADKLAAGKIKTLIGDSLLAPDAATVVLLARQKDPRFYEYWTIGIVEQKMVKKYGDAAFTDHLSEGGGSGPFKVARYIHKQEIDFVPNPYYFNLKPVLQKLIFRFFPDTSTAYQAYLNGDVDYSPVPDDRIDAARQSGQYRQNPALLMRVLEMNFLTKPFDNLHIRQAFALSLNREIINKLVYNGTQISSYHLIMQGLRGYNLNLTGPANVKDSRGNFSLARQLFQLGLKEEGWSTLSSLPPIKLTMHKNPESDKFINVVTGMWKEVLGVTVQPNSLDDNSFFSSIDQATNNAHGIQMWYVGLGGILPDTGTLLDQCEQGDDFNNMNYGQNTSSDALQEQAIQAQLVRADNTEDATLSIQLYQNAEQQLINQVCMLPVIQETWVDVVKPYVQNATSDPRGITPLGEWTTLSIAVH